MEQKELQLLPDKRQLIHNLIIQMHRSGLSPPECIILDQLEAEEASSTDIRGND